MAKACFYAVKVGRQVGVFDTWAEAEASTKGYPGAVHKKHTTREKAQEWLAGREPTRVFPLPVASGSNTRLAGQNARFFSNHSTPQQSAPNMNRTPSTSSSALSSPGRSKDNAIEITDSPHASPKKPTRLPANKIRILAPITKPGASGSSLAERLKRAAAHVDDADPSPMDLELSAEQQKILDKVLSGKSLFFTGSAGTGKSVLMRAIINALHQTYNKKNVAVTAPTGIAAVNIGGTTLHSWAGIGLGKENVKTLLEKRLQNNKSGIARWEDTRVLIVDEISMVDGNLFDKLETIARIIRKIDEPFGGIQLVVSGDFFQLPPVPDTNEGRPVPVSYAFDALTWPRCVPLCYKLTHVFRQRDQEFVDMLNKMRVGELEQKAIDQFKRLSRNLVYEDGLEPTQLFPLKRQVEAANSKRLQTLPGPSYIFHSVDTPGRDLRGNTYTEQDAQKILERMIALKEVHLRKGAQVMLIQNMKQGRLVNGSLGRVTGFVDPRTAREDGYEIAKADHSRTVAAPPVFDAPGFSGSISQASSRSDISASLRLMSNGCDCDPEFGCICSEDEVENGKGKAPERTATSDSQWPIVEFTNGDTLVLPPMEFTATNFLGIVEAKRMQIPLILAYALSIHKSQGQTLERVKVDLGNAFEKGQAYVALSRATSMQTLQVLNFEASKVMAHPRVIEWSQTLRVHTLGDDSDESEQEEEDSGDEVQEIPPPSQLRRRGSEGHIVIDSDSDSSSGGEADYRTASETPIDSDEEMDIDSYDEY